ncbi:hypothetical protein [Streptomyces sp. NPDC047028]|uniref:hypothetical protein n=1 Tax=Streptomyces sp. NPDC047028 TaxID=3155793 RepID=UPI0033F6A0AF
MPADEVTHGADVEESRARTGPRHAAPKRPLFTRFHMPAGKAIATVAMPTAVLVGLGFTSSLALAAGGSPSPSTTAKSLTADEYKDCVKALDKAQNATDSPSPSASQSASADKATPSPTATSGTKDTKDAKDTGKADTGSSSDSGSDAKSTPKPTTDTKSTDTGSGSTDTSKSSGPGTGDTTTPTQTSTQKSGGLLGTIDDIGTTLGGILTGGKSDSGTTASPSPSASQSASDTSSSSSASSSSDKTSTSSDKTSTAGKDTVTGTVKDTASKATKTVTDTVKDTVKDTTGTVTKTAGDATKTVTDTAKSADPSPSAGSGTSSADCPAATEDVSGVDNSVAVADDPWYLNASSLLLKGADYQGIVEVKTANGTKKKVLKYVISGGTDIGDLHQTVQDKQAGKTYHVQAAKGSTSTIRNGDTVMYTESISGNLFGLIPVTFSPDSPPPLNIPLIYFTNVKVVQAGQFGGNLHVPGMHVYVTD